MSNQKETRLYIKNSEAMALVSVVLAFDKVFTAMKKQIGEERGISIDDYQMWQETYMDKIVNYSKIFAREMAEDCQLPQSFVDIIDNI